MLKVKVLIAQSCPTLCDPIDCSPPGSSAHRILQGRILGVGWHSLLQDIFLTQGSNLGLQHCRQILYCLSHKGRPLPHATTHQISCYYPPKSTHLSGRIQ